ncbi:hypothetical protein [Azospirillum brasilense]|jgi:hypothetical protein|uniref:hypothetical protein n=1 Tax=Azospirillum brasilense TaxID=192 RepID=UPI001EDA09B4|nr:hypothetical protein [Azospirillum brasilense]UKJ78131.1 hypothetical protein H1Q64_32560 [Azospirillum brasilense]
MPSIDELTADVFDDDLVPIAEERRREGRPLFPLEPDAAVESYFTVPPDPVAASGALLSAPVTDDPQTFAAALTAMWHDQGCGDLADLKDRIVALIEAAQKDLSVPCDRDVVDYNYTFF